MGRPMQLISAVLVCCGLSCQVFAADNPAPSWGRMVEEQEQPGVYRLEVVQPPADGRLVLPENLRSFVRCEHLDGNSAQPVDFESDAANRKAVMLLPKAPEARKGLFRVYTRGKSPQSDDGRVTLLDQDLYKPKSAGTTEPRIVNCWKYEGTRTGRYSVWVSYSNSNAEEANVEVSLGAPVLSAELPTTENARRSRCVKLGSVSVSATGRLTPVLLLVGPVRSGVEIRGLLLVPDCEGKPPVQTGDEPLVLHARDSTVQGTMLRYEADPKKNTLGYWVRASDAATWDFTMQHAGEYEVEVLQGCGKGEGGSEISVRLAGQDLRFIVQDTGHFQNFKPRVIGRVRLNAGQSTLVVRPRKIARHAALDLRQVRLIPVREK